MNDILTCAGRAPRVTIENRAAPHQMVLTFTPPGNAITVSCTCSRRRYERNGGKPLAARKLFPAPAAIAVWKAHVAAEGTP